MAMNNDHDAWLAATDHPPTDYRSLYGDARERVRQLEKLNTTLAVQVDRLEKIHQQARQTTPSNVGRLFDVIRDYDKAMAQLAKESGDGNPS